MICCPLLFPEVACAPVLVTMHYCPCTKSISCLLTVGSKLLFVSSFLLGHFFSPLDLIHGDGNFRLEDVEALGNKHAVDNPEEVAAAVDMWVLFSSSYRL